jgi:hypothetical protein
MDKHLSSALQGFVGWLLEVLILVLSLKFKGTG